MRDPPPQRGVPGFGVVWMDACSAVDPVVLVRQLQGCFVAGSTRSGNNDGLDACGACARQHVIEIAAKTFVGEIGADVDQMHRCAIDRAA